jgi:hypothetical protein
VRHRRRASAVCNQSGASAIDIVGGAGRITVTEAS